MMNKDKFKFNGIFALLLLSASAMAQTVDFIPSGQLSSYSKYNINVSTASGVDGSGGFSFTGSSFATSTNYFVQASFDGGSTWHYIENASATDGTWIGSGMFRTSASGTMQIAFAHTRMTDLAAWPGNDGTINLRLTTQDGSTPYPGASGEAFTLDLTRPSISTSSITSNNSDTEWAKSGDAITVAFTTSENLSTDTNFDPSGNISGVAVTASGSGQSWSVANTVSTHSEGAATFNITYYDENENLGSSALTSTTDGSSVTIDMTSPTLTTSLASNNSTTTLAKTSDIVTLTIGSSEILQVAPTVTIDGNSITPNPNTSASSYSAARTMQSGDTQGDVAFLISNIKDRAGNTLSNQSSTSDGTAVTFDSVDPTLTGITIASNNALSSEKAKPDDVVTLTFYTSEKAQTPTATIVGENAAEANPSGDQLSWTATKTMDTEDDNGTVTFTIDFYDLAGNQGTQATAILSGNNVTYDKTDPGTNSITVASSNSTSTLATSGDVITIAVVTDEDLQTDDNKSPWGISSASIAGQNISAANISSTNATNWEISYTMGGGEADGAASYAFTLADASGNTTDISSAGSAVTIDNTKPTLTLVSIASNNANDAYAKEGDVITLTITSDEDLIAAPTVFLAGRSATVAAVGGSATDYTASITTNSTDTQGAVAISIAFSDLTGNAGNAVTATTNSSSVTFDRQVPTLSAVTVTSNNDNTDYAKEGDIVTLSFTSSENVIASPTVTMDGNAATVSGSNTSWAASYTMQSGDTEGDVDFTIDFQDIAGNSGAQVTSLTDGSKIVYDETTPTMPTVDISSNNGNGPTLAKVGDVITIAVTASENIQTPTITIAGNAASIASGSNGEKVYTATYTMQSSDNTGVVTFTVDFSDIANNDGTQVTAVANDSDGGVTFDKQAPSFTIVTIESDNSNDALAIVNDEITVSLTLDEDIKANTLPTVTINGNNATVDDDTKSSTYFDFKYSMSSPTDDAIDGASIPINISGYTDATGNTGATVTATTDGSAVIYDNTLPTLGTVTIASNNTYDHLAKENDVITLTIVSAEDINQPTVSMLGATTNVTVTEGATASNWTATKAVSGGIADGTAAFNVAFTDIAGNSGAAVTSLTGGDAVTVDKSAPTITTASMASNNGSGDELAVPGNIITLTIVSNENIVEPTVTIATQTATVAIGADAQNWTATYTMTENESNGTIPFSITFADSAGNDGTEQTALVNDADGDQVTYDKSQPVLSNVSLTTDNSFNDLYAKSGSVISLSFDSNEQLLNSSIDITINGVSRAPSKSLSWNGTKESWVATHTMTDATDDNGGNGVSIPFTIDYVDLNGYAGEQVVATSDGDEVTFDKTAPTITTLSYASNNSNLSTEAKTNDVVTVSIVGSELLQTPVLTVAGNAVADETAGGTNAIWTGTYQMQNTDSDGLIGLSLDYMDYSGNSGTTATTTTDGTQVTFDRTDPTLTTVTLTSNNNYSSSMARVGSVVTLTVVADESLISDPVFTIAGNNVTPTGANANWTGSYTMQDGDTEGNIAFNITFFDQAANAGDAVSATTDGSAVTFDKTATNLSSLSVDLSASSDTGNKDNDDLTNDTTPTFSITGLSGVNAIGDSIFLVIDTDTVSRKKVDANSVTFTSTTLANQVLPYSATIVNRDAAGNLSDPTTALPFRIDTQAPNTGNVLNLLTEDDSGFSNNDDITSNTRPNLEVSGLAAGQADSIRIFYDALNASLNDVVIGEYRMLKNHGDNLPQFVIDTLRIGSVLADDRYTFTYFVIDSAGNTSTESAGINVFIDATAPVTPDDLDLFALYDKGTSNSDNLTNAENIIFVASNVSKDDSIYIKNTLGTVVGSELVTENSGSKNVWVNGAVTSNYSLYAKDPAGNTSLTSGALTVTIDTDAPVVTGVTIDLDDDSDTGAANDDEITKDNTPSFTLTGLTATDSVFLFVDGTLDQKDIATSTTHSFTTSALNDNLHEITMKAKDYAGNLSALTDPPLEIRVDTTPFTIVTAPDLVSDYDSGISDSDDITNLREPKIRFTQLSSKTDSIRLFVNDGVSNEFVVGGTKDLDVLIDTLTIPNASRLDEGTYELTYVVIDPAGNESAASAGTSIKIDFTNPDTPSAPDLIASHDSGISDSDNLTNVTTMNLVSTGFVEGDFGLLYENDAIKDSLIVPSDGSLTYSVANDANGDYSYHVVAIDTAGNRSSNTLSLTITVDQDAEDVSAVGIDLDAASDTGTKDDDNLTNDTSPTFTVENLMVTDSVYLFFNGVQNQRLKASATTESITGDISGDDEYAVTIKSRDNAGNLSDASPAFSFRLDTTPHSMDGDTTNLLAGFDSGFSSQDDTTNSRVPQFEVKGLSPYQDSLHLYIQSGITNALVMRTVNGYNKTKDTLSVPDDKKLDPGEFLVTYVVIDSAGNYTDPSAPVTIIVDTLAPNVLGLPDLENSTDKGESIQDNRTNEARVTVVLTDILDGNRGVISLFVDDEEDPSYSDSAYYQPANEGDPMTPFYVDTPISGIYNVYSVHVDTAGNRSGSSDTLSIIVDRDLPTAAITYEGDGLVRSGDESTLATFTFSEEMDSVHVPTVTVIYPGIEDPLSDQPLTELGDGDTVWTFAIPLNTAGLDSINGNIELLVTANDVAGNVISNGDITGRTDLVVDNAAPTFTSVVPGSDSYSNVLNNFAWTLSEPVDSGTVAFNNLADETSIIVTLAEPERAAGDRETGPLSHMDSILTEEGLDDLPEGLYDMIFKSFDAAGNTGRDTISNYTYDITSSTATVTFSQLFASPGQVDTITVTFNEVMKATPTIQIAFPNEFDTPIDAAMTLPDSGDGTVWVYYFVVPEVTDQGNVTIGVTAEDLATNPLAAEDISQTDDLYIDITDPIATFTYANVSNPDLTNIGIGGDSVQVTVSMNEPLSPSDPIPTINYTFGWGDGEDGTTVTGAVPESTINADSVWIFKIALSDSVQDDGHINFELIAQDRSNNSVTSFVDENIFLVDNQPPVAFETGLISTHGLNPVQGWITGVTDTIGVQVPIQTYQEDSTLFLGGYVQIQFYNLNRGTAWVTPGPDDPIVESGPTEQFYRNIDSLYAVMDTTTGIDQLLTGDSLAVRARIVDRHGNITNGTTSGTRLAFDPTAPSRGEVSGGNFVEGDTLFSNDTVSVQWTAFQESDEDESGIERYEVSILKIDSLTLEGTLIHGWDTLAPDVTSYTQGLFLEHDTRYVGYIRAFDVAGNISDTLVTDTLLRYNSNPVILTMGNAILNEDLFWTDTVQLTDLDLNVMQGDSFTYQATVTRAEPQEPADTTSGPADSVLFIDSVGVFTWTPTQNDTGSYTIEIVATDAYGLTDTYELPLTVNAVNDTPVFVIPSSGSDLYYVHEWEEDQVADSIPELVLSRYIEDVDNDITTEITWQAVILDTSQLDEDYPLGQVIVGPNTPWEVHAKLNREYLGLDPQMSANDMSRMSHETIQLINNTRTNPTISCSIWVKQYEGVDDSVVATFSSAPNYYGDNHRIIFIAQDNGGAVAKDTIHASIDAKNDAPVIAKDMIAEVVEVWENDSIWMEFGQYVNDVDDTSLVFTLSAVVDAALGNDDKVTILPSVEFVGTLDDVTFTSSGLGDSVLFVPEKLFDDHVDIQLKVSDENASDSTMFRLDVRHVDRPKIAVSLLQQNAFTKFLQVIVTDTASKTVNLSMEVQNQGIALDTVAAHTYSGHLSFEASGNYSIDIYASAHVGDTTLSETFSLAAGKVASRWHGSSYDGRFSIIGNPGALSYDQPFLIADSSLFEEHFYDRASYVLGSENFYFNTPIEVRFASDRDDLAIYRRKNGVVWQELPSLTIENEIFTLSDQSGYFRLGPKTIIVPEQTNIHQNYPNPFNPTTTITYDIGLLDGLRQNVSINVYNLLGQNITTLVENKDQIGQFKIQWDGYDKFGQQMGSGVYFIQLTTKTGIVKNKKMMLLK